MTDITNFFSGALPENTVLSVESLSFEKDFRFGPGNCI